MRAIQTPICLWATRALHAAFAVLFVAGGVPRAWAAGALDSSFDADISFTNGYVVNSSSVQPDGKIVIVGNFTTVGGSTRNHIARVESDGTLDTGFNPNANNQAFATAIQSDGKILVCGNFTSIGGTARNYLARLNTDGSLDTGFDPSPNSGVVCLLLQADGKIVVGGSFTSIAGGSRNRIARLNSDGTLDTGFDPNANANVYGLSQQTDGKIFAGGFFSTIGGGSRTLMARLNTNGTLDTTFNASLGGTYVYHMAVQTDGKVIVGGYIGSAGGTPCEKLIRVSSTGALDTGFTPTMTDNVSGPADVYGMTLQADGKLIFAGNFVMVNTEWVTQVARLNTNGTTDTSFSPPVPDSNYTDVSLQADGKVLIGGYFNTMNGITRSLVARLGNDTATSTLTVTSSSRVQWQRGGTTPEAELVWFELSTDGGANWSALGAGTRISGGWELTGLSLPSSGLVRGRAQVRHGYTMGSSSLLEKEVSIAPEITVRGNSVEITDGDSTPSAPDHTVFGDTVVSTGTYNRVYTISNSGATPLSLSGISLSGTHSGDFAISGITLPTTVAAFASKTFTVTFDPSALGTRSATVTVASDDADEASYDFAIQGEAIEPEIHVKGNSVTIVDGDTTPSLLDHTDFGTPAYIGGSVVRTYTIENTGVTDLKVSGISISGLIGGDLVVGGISFPATIVPSASTTFTITFTPTVATRTGDVAVHSNDGDEGSYDFVITGKAAADADVRGNSISIADGDATPASGDHTDFGSVSIASGTIVRTFTIHNTATVGILDVTSIGISGVAAAEYTVGGITLPTTVAASSSKTFTVTFDPSSGGTRSAAVSIVNNDPDEGPYEFAIQGAGAGVEIYVNGNSNLIVDGDSTPDLGDHTEFGEVIITGGTLVRTFTIGNLGTTSLSVSAIGKSGTNSADFTVGGITFPRTVTAGSSTTFTVTFNPGAVGLRTAALSITNTDLDENPYNFSIQGTGFDPEIAVVGNGSVITDGDATPSTLDDTNFDSVMLGDETERVYTITNSGTGPLSITGITKSGTASANYTVTGISFPASVPAGGNTTFTVVFAPSAAGARAAALSIANTDANENPYNYSITGTGVAPGATDTGFNPDANSSVYGLGIQPDGKAALTGTFTSVSGSTRNRVARIDSGGSLDGFNPNANGTIYTASIQADEKVIVGGDFANVVSTARSKIARLNGDGSLDTGFNPGANGSVRSTLIQPNGKILVAGGFTTLGGSTRNYIGRLNDDGTLDTGFDPNANGFVYSMGRQSDGKIVIVGAFTSVGGTGRNYIARLNEDGTLDGGFNPGLNNPAYCVAIQADGEILVGGAFTNAVSTTRNRLARINADGTLDSFNPAPNGTTVYAITVQADGRILVGGDFTTITAVARNRIARLNAAGTLDTTFNPNASTASSSVYGLALQTDGEVVVAGDFTTIGGLTRNRIARLDNNVSAASLDVPSSARIEWLRDGAAPEAQDVTFELSTDGGSNWTLLGAGTRISGGWELTGLSLPGSGLICARARTVGGLYNGSAGLVETIYSY